MIPKFLTALAGTLIRYQGNWTTSVNYVAGDYVLDSGAYLCIAPNLSAAGNRPGNLTYWVPLGAVVTAAATYFKAQTTIPYVELVDGSSNDAKVRLNAGVLEFYDVTGAVARMSLNIQTGDLVVSGEKTDGHIIIPIAPGIAISGTWTPTTASNVLVVTRTVAVATQYYKVPIVLPARTTASKGRKLISIQIAYTMASADTVNDNLEFHVIKQVLPANTAAATATIIAGDNNAHYDASHNTKALRLATANHTLTITLPTPAYLAAGEQLYLEVMVTDYTTANLALALTGAVANYSFALY